MEISDYIFFSLISFTLIVIIGVAAYGIYCWWKSREVEPESCYARIADENTPLLVRCRGPCPLGSEGCSHGSSLDDNVSPPVFSPTYKTPGSKRSNISNRVLVTSGGFPITPSLLGYGYLARPKFGSFSSTVKRSPRSSLAKFTLIRDFTRHPYDNDEHATRPSFASPELESRTLETNLSNHSETPSIEAHSSSRSEQVDDTVASSSNHSEQARARRPSNSRTDPSSSVIVAPLAEFSDSLSAQEYATSSHSDQTSAIVHSSRDSDPDRAAAAAQSTNQLDQDNTEDAAFTRYVDPAGPNSQSEPAILEVTECVWTNIIMPVGYGSPLAVHSSKHSEPEVLEVSECITTNAFTPARNSTPFPDHAITNSSSFSDYEARSSSADNSWELSSSSIIGALGSNSSSLTDNNDVSTSQPKGSMHYVVRNGKGFYTSDTNVFTEVPL